MKKLLTLALLLHGAWFCSAQYAFTEIPDSLLKNAKIVKRFDELRVEIKNPGKFVYYRHYIYTILGEAGNNYAHFGSHYDKMTSIDDISGNLYDAFGKKIKSVKKKEITDKAVYDGMSFVTDNRIKEHNFYYNSYPYTIEYEETNTMDGMLSLPGWLPAGEPLVAVQNAKFIVVTPKDYNLRYKQFFYKGDPVITESKSNKIYTWEVKNVTAKTEEVFSPDWDEVATKVLIAPSDFEIEGYKGNMNSWQNFGKFMSALYAGRDVLPPAVKTKVQELTNGLKTDREKINILYKYMQENTHYIGIQLGIGGWQPLSATYVAEKKYGDCKALSNYMYALLKEAGIKSYNALIHAGRYDGDILKDFSSNQFNHVVLVVPGKKDSIWLECTSQTVQPGYMGYFTGNRHAVIIDENSATPVQTPVYTKDKNLRHRKVVAKVDEAGVLQADVNTLSTGLLQDDLHSIVHGLTKEEQHKRLKGLFSLPNYDVPEFSYKEGYYKDVPSVTESFKVVSKDYANITGKRMFIKPNIISTDIQKMAAEEKRVNDILIYTPYVEKDTVILTIPEGYAVEAMPKPVTISNKFGNYTNTYTYKDGSVQMVRVFERNNGRFPASSYDSLVDFYNAMYKADNARMVFVKQGE